MSKTNSPSRFSAYSGALKALSARTGTPLSSLVLSFGVLHEVTAVAPLFMFFYASRTIGVGDKMVKFMTEDAAIGTENQVNTNDLTRWGRRKLSGWVEEGDKWAVLVGTRYGVFGYEKRKPGEKPDVDALTHTPGHLAGDVANVVVAYAVTKALLPVRIGLSLYLAPAFSRSAVDPIRRFAMGIIFRRPK